MTEAFHQSGSENVLLVVLTNDNGLGPTDEDTYHTLIDKLRQDTRDVVMLQDFLSTPALRDVMTSKDHQAWYLPIGLAGPSGSPQLHEAYARVADIVKQTVAGSSATAHLTGPAATGADITDFGERDLHLIEIATAIMVLTILLIIYRNPVTMLLPLITIGIRGDYTGHCGWVSQLGFGISNQTIMLMSAMMAGAGIDYAVFLVSRYHDYLISVAGFPAVLRDTRDYYNHDIRFIIAVTIGGRAADSDRFVGRDRCTAIPDRFGGDFISVGARYRRHRLSVHSRPGIVLEHPRTDLYRVGRSGRRLQYAAHLPAAR